MSSYVAEPLTILPEFTPETDNTSVASGGYVSLEKVRIFNNAPQTVGGFVDLTSQGSFEGACRLIYNQSISSLTKTILGTHSRLYSYFNSELVNITPLQTATVTLGANPIQTYFITLAANPLTTVNGQNYIDVAYVGHRFVTGDTVTIAGVGAAVNGIPAAEINGTHNFIYLTANSFRIYCSTNATSSGTGGGGAVTVASGLITVTDNAHGLTAGQRVKLLAATGTGGITGAQINLEFIIRSNVTTNTYDLMTAGTSSSAAAGGGAGVTRQKQIAEGNEDASAGVGYGMGLYGAGLYGAAAVGDTVIKPRIWSADAYGEYMIMTAGGQTGIYEWDGDTSAAPVLVTNAPTAVNYVFVDREQIIALGAGGVVNNITTSDTGQRTVWTGTSQNECYEKTIYGAGEFISHAHVQDLNLLFTSDAVYTMRYIGQPLIWEVKPVAGAEGLIAQNARVAVNNLCFWMSDNDIFVYNGGIISSITTDNIRSYLFGNLTREQKSKIHFAYNKKFSEIRIYYPRGGSTECNAWLDYSLKSNRFVGAATEYGITAQEVPFNQSQYPVVAFSSRKLQQIDCGDIGGIQWALETAWLFNKSRSVSVHGLIPDSIQDNDISLIAYAKDFPQSAEVRETTVQTVSPTDEEVFFDEGLIRGKCRKYKIYSNNTGFWRAGAWHEYISPSTERV